MLSRRAAMHVREQGRLSVSARSFDRVFIEVAIIGMDDCQQLGLGRSSMECFDRACEHHTAGELSVLFGQTLASALPATGSDNDDGE
jgi:hypothetical protein